MKEEYTIMVLNRSPNHNSLLIKLVFYCVFGCSLLIGLYLILSYRVNTEANVNHIAYIDRWTVIDKDGKQFETGRTYQDERAFHEEFTIVPQLPNEIWHDSVLCFLNRSDVSVYMNDELRKDFRRMEDTGIPGGSLKEFYMTVPLASSDAGASIRMVRGPTDWNPTVVPETFVSSHEGVYDYLIEKYGVSFGLSVILFVASLLVLIIGIVMRFWKHRTIEMLYAALGILNVSCWLIAVNQLTPFITRVYFVDGIMGFLFSMMMPLALLIYINSIQKGRFRMCHITLFLLSLVNYTACTILHFTGIRSLQESLVFSDTILGLVAVCVSITVAIDLKKGYIKDYPYTAIGILTFLFMSLLEIIMLIFFAQKSNEIPILIGLLCLLVLVVVQQVYDFRRIRSSLEKEVRDRTAEKEQMLIHIVQTLAGTIDAKDTYTNGHSSRVADYSREIARRYGYQETELNDIYMMGLLHDIGKIGIPNAIINKPARLTADERKVIMKHPEMGAKILENIKEKKSLAMGAHWHHERYDGCGYPDKINGDDIRSRQGSLP